MLPSHRPLIESLSDVQRALLLKLAREAGLIETSPRTASADVAFGHLRAGGVYLADCVQLLRGRDDYVSIDAVERLLGDAPVCQLPASAAVLRDDIMGLPAVIGCDDTPGGQRRKDRRVVVALAPNPKKPGTKARERYDLYRVGMTAQEYLRLGGTARDLHYDEYRGYVRFSEGPSSQRASNRRK